MRGCRAIVAVNLFIGFFGPANHHLLVRNAHAIQLLEIMLPALNEHIAAAGIHAIFNDRHFTAGLKTGRVFRTVDETAQVALFNPAETVHLFFHLNRIAEGRHGGLSHGEVHLMTRREDMNQDIILGRRRQALAVYREIFKLFGTNTAAQLAPDVIAKSHHRAQLGVRKLRLKGR